MADDETGQSGTQEAGVGGGIERRLPLVGAGAAASYALGFIITSLYAANFPVSTVDFPRAMCVLTGVPWLAILVLGVLAVRRVCEIWRASSISTGELRRWRTVVGTLLGLVCATSALMARLNRSWEIREVAGHIFSVSLVCGLLGVLAAWYLSRRRADTRDQMLLAGGVLLGALGICAWLYATGLYPVVPGTLGGGKPLRCDVVLDLEKFDWAAWERYGQQVSNNDLTLTLLDVKVLCRNSAETVLGLTWAEGAVIVPNNYIVAFVRPSTAGPMAGRGAQLALQVKWSELGRPQKPGVYTTPDGKEVDVKPGHIGMVESGAGGPDPTAKLTNVTPPGPKKALYTITGGLGERQPGDE